MLKWEPVVEENQRSANTPKTFTELFKDTAFIYAPLELAEDPSEPERTGKTVQNTDVTNWHTGERASQGPTTTLLDVKAMVMGQRSYKGLPDKSKAPTPPPGGGPVPGTYAWSEHYLDIFAPCCVLDPLSPPSFLGRTAWKTKAYVALGERVLQEQWSDWGRPPYAAAICLVMEFLFNPGQTRPGRELVNALCEQWLGLDAGALYDFPDARGWLFQPAQQGNQGVYEDLQYVALCGALEDLGPRFTQSLKALRGERGMRPEDDLSMRLPIQFSWQQPPQEGPTPNGIKPITSMEVKFAKLEDKALHRTSVENTYYADLTPAGSLPHLESAIAIKDPDVAGLDDEMRRVSIDDPKDGDYTPRKNKGAASTKAAAPRNPSQRNAPAPPRIAPQAEKQDVAADRFVSAVRQVS